jgi:hypothetical protein
MGVTHDMHACHIGGGHYGGQLSSLKLVGLWIEYVMLKYQSGVGPCSNQGGKMEEKKSGTF